MELDEIIKNLNRIFIDELGNKNIVLTFSTTAKDVKEWDSLSHIQIIVAIEKYFNVHFSSKEIRKWKNVGEMCSAIKEKAG